MTRQVSDDIVRASDRTEDVVVSTADVGNKFKFFETYKEPEKERKAFRITPPREGQAKVKTAKPALHRCVLCLANMSSASDLSVNTSCSGYINVLRCRTNCTPCETALRHPVDTTRPRLSVCFSPRVSLYRIFNIKYRIFNDWNLLFSGKQISFGWNKKHFYHLFQIVVWPLVCFAWSVHFLSVPLPLNIWFVR